MSGPTTGITLGDERRGTGTTKKKTRLLESFPARGINKTEEKKNKECV